jgi:hypothetical protein
MMAKAKPHKPFEFESVLLAIAGHDLRQPLHITCVDPDPFTTLADDDGPRLPSNFNSDQEDRLSGRGG